MRWNKARATHTHLFPEMMIKANTLYPVTTRDGIHYAFFGPCVDYPLGYEVAIGKDRNPNRSITFYRYIPKKSC